MGQKRKLFISEGQKFGRLTIIKETNGVNCQGRQIRNVMCICDCGNIISPIITSLFSGATKSCGCLQKEFIIKLQTKHSMSFDPIYRIYLAMKERCYYKSGLNYHRWGGRGIIVCDEWMNDCNLFFEWSYKNGYRKGLTLERIDNNKGYSPENCIFTNRLRQANNTRTNHIIKFNDEEMSMADFCRKYDLNYPKFARRIVRQKYSLEKAMINCNGFIRTR